MRSIEQLTEEILSLPIASRVLLVEKLVESLEFDTDPEIQTAWLSEAKRRRDEVRNGSLEVIRGDEALIKLHLSQDFVNIYLTKNSFDIPIN